MTELIWVAAVFGLLSSAQSAPVTSCESLTKHDVIVKDQLLGQWSIIAEAAEDSGASALLRSLVETAWWNITETDTTDALRIFHHQKMSGRCASVQMVVTVKNQTLTMDYPYATTIVKLTSICPDCLILYTTSIMGGNTSKGLQILSRRNTLSTEEMDEFRNQARCLNLPSLPFLDPKKGFCLDPNKSLDLTDQFTSENMEKIDDLISSPGYLDLIKNRAS